MFLMPLAIWESRSSKFVFNSAPVIVFDVFSSAVDFRGLNLVNPNHFFNWTTYTWEYFTPEIHSPDPNVSEIRRSFDFKLCSFPFLGNGISNQSFWLLHQNIRTLCGVPRISRTCRTCWASTLSIKGVSSLPTLPLPERYPASQAYCVGLEWCHNSLLRACDWATPSFDLSKIWEICWFPAPRRRTSCLWSIRF